MRDKAPNGEDIPLVTDVKMTPTGWPGKYSLSFKMNAQPCIDQIVMLRYSEELAEIEAAALTEEEQ